MRSCFYTIIKHEQKHIYMANWFLSAFFITVAISHIVSNLAVPVTLTKSFPIYAGTVDAMVQRW